MRVHRFHAIGCLLVALSAAPAYADDLLVQVRLDKSVTEVDSSGNLKPIHVALYVQNLSGNVIQLKLSKQHTFRLEKTFNLGPNPSYLPTVAEGTLTPTYGQFWNGLSLGPHSETLIAVGTLPDSISKWDLDAFSASDHRLAPGTYQLDVQLPDDPRFTLTGPFPGWSSAAITVVDSTGAPQATTPVPQPKPETPWLTGGHGIQTQKFTQGWNYNVGYQFIPQVNGKVTKLGAYFTGTATVRLYDSSGSVLALGNVSANYAWDYAAITPVDVVAGKTYTVAVLINGNSGGIGSYRTFPNDPFPKTFGNIKILQSVWADNTERMPSAGSTNYMWGQADIEFVPDAR